MKFFCFVVILNTLDLSVYFLFFLYSSGRLKLAILVFSFFILPVFGNCFFFKTLPRRPAFQSLFTADDETGVLWVLFTKYSCQLDILMFLSTWTVMRWGLLSSISSASCQLRLLLHHYNTHCQQSTLTATVCSCLSFSLSLLIYHSNHPSISLYSTFYLSIYSINLALSHLKSIIITLALSDYFFTITLILCFI